MDPQEIPALHQPPPVSSSFWRRTVVGTSGLVFRPIQGGKATYHAIDLLRGLAAMSVLIFHYNHFFEGGGRLNIAYSRIADVPAFRNAIVMLIYEHGANAVQMFWTISGFVFVHIYAGRRQTLTAKAYFVNRFARLYPLHFLTLIVVAMLQAASMECFGNYKIYEYNDLRHFVLQLFFASEWGLQRGRSFNGPIWSVSVEVLIYLVYFVYIKMMPVNIATISGAIVAFMAAYVATKSLVMLCGFYFFAGALAYAIFELSAGIPRGARVGSSAAAFLVALGGLAAVVWKSYPVPMSLLLAPLFMSLLALVTVMEDAWGHRGLLWARPIGEITYSSYLWHSPLQILFLILASAGLVSLEVLFTTWFFPTYLVVVCVFSWFSYVGIEKPAQRLIRDASQARRPDVPMRQAE